MLPSGVFGLGRETRLPDLLLMEEDPLLLEEEGRMLEEEGLPVVTNFNSVESDSDRGLLLSKSGVEIGGGEK